MNRSTFRRILLGISLLLTAACSRPLKEGSLHLSVPALTKQSKISGMSLSANDSLQTLIVNLSASDIPTRVIHLENKCNGCSASFDPFANPPIFNDVPSGNDRLIQVVAVYSNSSTNGMSIYYGEKNIAVAGGNQDVTVDLSQVGGSYMVQGQVSGRYFNSASAGPTGIIDVLFVPPNGKTMLVDQSTIFNGWFSVFMLSGASLEYVVRNPADGSVIETMWGGPVSLDDPAMDPAMDTTRRVKAYFPLHKKIDGGGVSVEPPMITLNGYWAPNFPSAITSMNANYDFSTANFSNRQTYAGGVLSINSVSSFQPNSVMYGTTYTTVDVKGGNYNPSAPTYSTSLLVKTSLLDKDRDHIADFYGPIQPNATTHNLVNLVPDAMTLKTHIMGQVLPGVNNDVDTFVVYKTVLNDPTKNLNMHNPSCDPITLALYGFQASGSGTLSGTNFDIVTDMDGLNNGNNRAIMCPMKNGKVVAGGIFLGEDFFGNFYGTPQVANSLALTYQGNYIGSGGQCMFAHIEGRLNGNPAQFPQGATLAFSSPDPVSFYTSPDCSTSPIAGPVSAMGNTYGFYLKYTGGSAGVNVHVNVTSSVGSVSGLNASITTAAPSGSEYILVDGPAAIQKYECYNINYVFAGGTMGSLVPEQRPAGTMYGDLNPILTMYSGLAFYTDGYCTVASGSTFAFNGPTQTGSLFFSYSGSQSSISLGASGSGASPTYTGTTLSGPVSVASPSSPHHISIWTPSNPTHGACNPMLIRVEDQNGHLTPESSLTLNLASTGGGTFYSASGCSGSITSTSITSMQTKKLIWYMAPALSGPASVTAIGSVPSSDPSGAIQLNVQ